MAANLRPHLPKLWKEEMCEDAKAQEGSLAPDGGTRPLRKGLRRVLCRVDHGALPKKPMLIFTPNGKVTKQHDLLIFDLNTGTFMGKTRVLSEQFVRMDWTKMLNKYLVCYGSKCLPDNKIAFPTPLGAHLKAVVECKCCKNWQYASTPCCQCQLKGDSRSGRQSSELPVEEDGAQNEIAWEQEELMDVEVDELLEKRRELQELLEAVRKEELEKAAEQEAMLNMELEEQMRKAGEFKELLNIHSVEEQTEMSRRLKRLKFVELKEQLRKSRELRESMMVAGPNKQLAESRTQKGIQFGEFEEDLETAGEPEGIDYEECVRRDYHKKFQNKQLESRKLKGLKQQLCQRRWQRVARKWHELTLQQERHFRREQLQLEAELETAAAVGSAWQEEDQGGQEQEAYQREDLLLANEDDFAMQIARERAQIEQMQALVEQQREYQLRIEMQIEHNNAVIRQQQQKLLAQQQETEELEAHQLLSKRLEAEQPKQEESRLERKRMRKARKLNHLQQVERQDQTNGDHMGAQSLATAKQEEKQQQRCTDMSIASVDEDYSGIADTHGPKDIGRFFYLAEKYKLKIFMQAVSDTPNCIKSLYRTQNNSTCVQLKCFLNDIHHYIGSITLEREQLIEQLNKHKGLLPHFQAITDIFELVPLPKCMTGLVRCVCHWAGFDHVADNIGDFFFKFYNNVAE